MLETCSCLGKGNGDSVERLNLGRCAGDLLKGDVAGAMIGARALCWRPIRTITIIIIISLFVYICVFLLFCFFHTANVNIVWFN